VVGSGKHSEKNKEKRKALINGGEKGMETLIQQIEKSIEGSEKV